MQTPIDSERHTTSFLWRVVVGFDALVMCDLEMGLDYFAVNTAKSHVGLRYDFWFSPEALKMRYFGVVPFYPVSVFFFIIRYSQVFVSSYIFFICNIKGRLKLQCCPPMVCLSQCYRLWKFWKKTCHDSLVLDDVRLSLALEV